MVHHYQSIYKSEIENFENSCRDHGFDPSEFKLVEHDIVYFPPNSETFNINGKLTISRNGISKTYNTGNGTHWSSDFEGDLINRYFKK